MVDSVVFISIIKYQVYFGGKFLMYVLVCQSFILDSVTCQIMPEASAGNDEEDPQFSKVHIIYATLLLQKTYISTDFC